MPYSVGFERNGDCFSAGDYCRPCQCSGNINPDDPGSCDSVTGDCLRCLNNTYGMACNLCAPGYFGDAVHLKDCQSKDFMDSAVVCAGDRDRRRAMVSAVTNRWVP
jgi:hypothetical protein